MASANVADDWQVNKTVIERNRIMLERELHTDVTFAFGAKTESSKCTNYYS